MVESYIALDLFFDGRVIRMWFRILAAIMVLVYIASLHPVEIHVIKAKMLILKS